MPPHSEGSCSPPSFTAMIPPHGFRPTALALLAAALSTILVAAEPPSARLVNIATRTAVGGNAGSPIPGFVLAGTGSRTMLVRAVGPTLGGFGVSGTLADPQLSLVSGGTPVASNDNWLAADAAVMSGSGAFALTSGSKDAALVSTLSPGAYTAPVSGVGNTAGVALLEVYDASASSSSYLVNASTRAFVGTGDSVLIPAFVIAGPGSLRLLIRAVGPTLNSFGVTGTLADPTITLYRGNTAIASNDNWGASANATDIAAAATAFGAFALPNNSRDAALLVTLPAGSYSAVVSGVGNGTGTALVELYSETPAAPPPPSTPGFSITGLTTGPTVPTYLDPVNVSARVQPPAGSAVSQVQLAYATTGAPVRVTMFDDGQHDDGAAGDGVFGATIPAQAAGATVTYSISATSSAGGTANSAPASYLVAASLADTTFTNPEFLGIPTPQGITLNLESPNTLEVYVEYGTSPGVYSGQTPAATYPGGTPIELKIQSSDSRNPFQANRRYYYRVRYRSPGEATYRSRGERSFTTARPRGQPFSFTITADPHMDENTLPALFSLAMRNILADRPDFNVDLGDIMMSDKIATIIPGLQVNFGAVEYRAVVLRNAFSEFAHSVPFFFTLGNHEAEYRYLYDADRSPGKDNNIPAWNLLSRKMHFPTPVPDGSFYTGSAETRLIAGKDELLENYYAWEWGDALFVVLDPYNNTATNPGSNPGDNWRWSLGRTQYDWLKQTLQNSRAKFKFLFLHHLVGGVASARGGVESAHRYEWGGKNLDGTEGFADKRPGWGVPIHQLLVANKVSAVFHGHDHFYAYQQLDGVVYQECPQPGTAQFNTGSQNDGQYTTGVILPNSGYLRVSVAPDSAKVEYVRAALPTQETAVLKNRTIAHTYTIAPAN